MRHLLCFLLLSFFIFSGSSCTDHPQIYTAEKVFEIDAATSGSSIWHPDRRSLFWIDMQEETLYEYLPETKDCNTWKFNRTLSTIVPETDTTVIVAFQNEIARINLNNQNITTVAYIPDKNGTLSCNNGECDPEGRLWVSTTNLNGTSKASSLYCILSDGTVTAKLTDVSISNGIVWSANKKYMYHNNASTGRITRYRYDVSNGDILYDGTAITISSKYGSPNSMTIDSNDNLWIALQGGFGVYCYNPYTGELLAKVEVPAPNVTSCAFGGKNMNELYITTARNGLSEEELKEYPLSGSLFHCMPNAKGIATNRFHN
ncbi:SMP-30/gluconolactonase/LRE family protein [Parabacteroides bouchesdurhonensis]|uniref:SMP-30/gluconolactonase/LRE family protein n=1 Tax=Parabacteroides bouchesdurhonensis TaxID=1936995 RepID=UPI000E50D9B0|nr:SMP-30/gluconolactonase/LRE family protein [Parabacteroides bouchesdurhonensis]RHJ92143.1 SMP-30/gluconolactonase/LRE family protein [Bacteroides sp. AM07-16]